MSIFNSWFGLPSSGFAIDDPDADGNGSLDVDAERVEFLRRVDRLVSVRPLLESSVFARDALDAGFLGAVLTTEVSTSIDPTH